MHHPQSRYETLAQIGIPDSPPAHHSDTDRWLERAIAQLSPRAHSTDTTCIASESCGYYYVTHGETTHHLTAYEAYRFLQSILWLYNLEAEELPWR